jgi:hypothetical protein
MEIKSKHWGDSLKWLTEVVNSCKTPEQAKNCENLVNNFVRIYENTIGHSAASDLVRDLRYKLYDKELSIL